jgi:hypothetical protein
LNDTKQRNALGFTCTLTQPLRLLNGLLELLLNAWGFDMANPWFRLYSEFAHDPKIQMMPEAMQRRYIMLMCMRCSETLETLHEAEIAFQMRLTDEELTKTKELFLSKGFIDDEWNLTNWEKRQYVSDTSTARVRKHRDKKKDEVKQDETFQQRPSNALEQNRTEQKQTKKAESDDSLFEAFWSSYPKKAGKDAAKKAFAKRNPDQTLTNKMIDAVRLHKQSESWMKDGGQFIPHPATWLNQGRWMDEIEGGLPVSAFAGGI